MTSKLRYLLFLLPAAILVYNSSIAHWMDMGEFQRWAYHQRKNYSSPPPYETTFANTYRNTQCTYPPLGTIMTGGAWRVLDSIVPETTPTPIRGSMAFRWYLCVFETLWLLLMFLILRELHGPAPWFLAFVFYAVPSSWAGGAIWGQIDTINHALMLLSAFCSVRLLMRPATGPDASSGLVVGGLLALAAAMMLKHWTLFSLPGLLGLWACALAALGQRHGWRRGWITAGVSIALVAVFCWILDRVIFQPHPGHSGILSWVWTVGVGNTKYLSANAPNLWTFLGRENYSSSDAPFSGSLTPREAGMTAFLAISVLISIALGRHSLPALFRSDRLERDRKALCLQHFYFIGLMNFAMFLFIAGTHDRYAYHALLFLCLAIYAWPEAENRKGFLLKTFLVTGTIYGCFVYTMIQTQAFQFLFVLRNQAFVAAVCLGAFLIFFWNYLQPMFRRGLFIPDVPEPVPFQPAVNKPQPSTARPPEAPAAEPARPASTKRSRKRV